MPIRTSRTTAPAVLRRVTGFIAMAFAVTVHASGMPERGMSSAAVERAFGAPEQKRAPVGQPPISRWQYPDFTVYFEGDYTLHAVSHRPPPAPVPTPEVISDPAPEAGAAAAESRAEYRFDPATGEIIPMNGAAAPGTAAPGAAAPEAAAPALQPEPAPQPTPETQHEIRPAPAAPVPATATPPAAAETPAQPEQPPAEETGKRPARFRFDPASGRIIMDDGQPPATANPDNSATATPASEPEQSRPDAVPPASAPPEPNAAAADAPDTSPEAPADDSASAAGGFRMQW